MAGIGIGSAIIGMSAGGFSATCPNIDVITSEGDVAWFCGTVVRTLTFIGLIVVAMSIITAVVTALSESNRRKSDISS